jgi:hypothetical protein
LKYLPIHDETGWFEIAAKLLLGHLLEFDRLVAAKNHCTQPNSQF